METLTQSKVHILIHCPQCGGDIDFLEEAQVICCEFCGSSLLVAGRSGVLRYVVPAQIQDPRAAQALACEYVGNQGKSSPHPAETFLFYAPFWRMQGTVYRWVFGRKTKKISPLSALETRPTPQEKLDDFDFAPRQSAAPIKEREKVLLSRALDHTIAGTRDMETGLLTLGLRVQSLRLRPFGREHLEQRYSFLPLEFSLEQAQSEVERLSLVFFEADDFQPEVILHRLVGKGFSVIYFPIWYVECRHGKGKDIVFIDGVSKGILKSLPEASALLAKLKSEETRKPFQFSEIRFLPFRCPNCGWEFPFFPLSLLHFCPSCRRLFRERGGEWGEVKYAVVSPPEEIHQDEWLWFPFWRCRTIMESGDKKLETMAGLYQLIPPLKVIDQGREARRPIYFYIPAFKFRNPPAFQKVGSRLTFIQPEITPGAFADNSHPSPVGGSLSEADALEMGPVILGGLVPPNYQRVLAWLRECQVGLLDPQVFYFPFTRADLFWKEVSTGISFQHNAYAGDLPPIQK